MKITIDYEPTPKGRPRTKYVNGQVITYTPQRTHDAQEAIKGILLEYSLDPFPKHTPIKISITFYRTKSKWLPKRETMPFRKPDLDNFNKLLLDSLNGLIFPDDAQITTIIAKKRWSPNNHGYIQVKLEEDKL
jgi:Holliday junction resolvase RusA-like endonuclease